MYKCDGIQGDDEVDGMCGVVVQFLFFEGVIQLFGDGRFVVYFQIDICQCDVELCDSDVVVFFSGMVEDFQQLVGCVVVIFGQGL